MEEICVIQKSDNLLGAGIADLPSAPVQPGPRL
jgi:hypothetical protein